MSVIVNYCLLFTLLLLGCDNHVQSISDTADSGTIYISVDESFKPVIQEQIKLFESSYPKAHIIASYKSEVECLRDFFKDSTNRLIIVGRGLNRKEEHFMIDSLGYNPSCNKVATDAIAIVLNKSNKDTLFSFQDLQDQLTGKIKNNKIFIFDGRNATSTVRLIKDSILKGKEYDTAVVKATNSSNEVLQFVSTHPNAIGFVGISWIGNPEDNAQVKLLNTVKLGYIQCDLCDGKPFVKPIQQSMLTRRYPLTRSLFYICKENFSGLGTGFTSFLKYERGQLIFKRAYLGSTMDFGTRNIQINQSLPKN